MFLLQLQVFKFNGPTLPPPLHRIRPPMYGNYGIKKFIKRNNIDKTKYFKSLIYFCKFEHTTAVDLLLRCK